GHVFIFATAAPLFSLRPSTSASPHDTVREFTTIFSMAALFPAQIVFCFKLTHFLRHRHRISQRKKANLRNQSRWQTFPVESCLICSSMYQKVYSSVFGMVAASQASGSNNVIVVADVRFGEIVIAAVEFVKESPCHR
ncbi:hypothetical protein L195_g049667, partial [Trifolium pratense]